VKPDWLEAALSKLRSRYPLDSFGGLRQAGPEPGDSSRPRIRCDDCPGKYYQPGPGRGVDNFEVHLKNRGHRERVEKRMQRERELGR